MPAPAHILDFELQVTPGGVEVLRSPAGEGRASFQAPFDAAALALLREHLELARQANGTMPLPLLPLEGASSVEQAGERLFAALFSGDVYALYQRSCAIARAQRDQVLRLKLRLDEQVAGQPWELLRDPADDYLVLAPGLTLVRYQPLPLAVEPLAVAGPLRLVVAAGYAPDLNLAGEIHAIREALAPLVDAGTLALSVVERASFGRLYELLRREGAHVLHFLGHGEEGGAPGAGRLAFWDDDALGMELVTPQQLWRMLRRVDTLRMIWLNSCGGAAGGADAPLQSTAVELVRAGVPAVIANQQPIGDVAATTLARAFYQALAEGLPVDYGLAEARAMLSLSLFEALEWATPVLFMRSPDGVLFTHGQQVEPSTAPPEPQAQPGFTTIGTSIAQGAHMPGGTINVGDIAGGSFITGAGSVAIDNVKRRDASAEDPAREE